MALYQPNNPIKIHLFLVKYVIKNKGEVTTAVVGRLSDVEQTYGVGSIGYCFAPKAVVEPILISLHSLPPAALPLSSAALSGASENRPLPFIETDFKDLHLYLITLYLMY